MTTAASALTAPAPAAGAGDGADHPASAPASPAGGALGAGSTPASSAPANDNQPGASRLDWLGDAADELHTFAKANGYKSPADVVTNVQELQRFLGADKAGRGMVLPKDEDDAEGWATVHAKLGRPEKADGYGFLKIDGIDEAFGKEAAESFFSAGLNERQASQLVEWWGKTVTAQAEAETAEYLRKADEEMDALKAEWGGAAAANEELARRGAQQFGFSGEELDKIERAIGTKTLMMRFLAVGKSLGEDSVPKGSSANDNALTPATAQEQIAQLMGDSEFSAKLRKGEPAAKAKMERLYKAAYPG